MLVFFSGVGSLTLEVFTFTLAGVYVLRLCSGAGSEPRHCHAGAKRHNVNVPKYFSVLPYRPTQMHLKLEAGRFVCGCGPCWNHTHICNCNGAHKLAPISISCCYIVMLARNPPSRSLLHLCPLVFGWCFYCAGFISPWV
jgi:hypothetical protein